LRSCPHRLAIAGALECPGRSGPAIADLIALRTLPIGMQGDRATSHDAARLTTPTHRRSAPGRRRRRRRWRRWWWRRGRRSVDTNSRMKTEANLIVDEVARKIRLLADTS